VAANLFDRSMIFRVKLERSPVSPLRLQFPRRERSYRKFVSPLLSLAEEAVFDGEGSEVIDPPSRAQKFAAEGASRRIDRHYLVPHRLQPAFRDLSAFR
jgi:hypothetical protein